MSAAVAGTFANGQSVGVGQTSGVLVIPSHASAFALYLDGDIDASNTVKVQTSANNGVTWADGDTYDDVEVATSVNAAAGTHVRLMTVAGEANKAINYKLSVES